MRLSGTLTFPLPYSDISRPKQGERDSAWRATGSGRQHWPSYCASSTAPSDRGNENSEKVWGIKAELSVWRTHSQCLCWLSIVLSVQNGTVLLAWDGAVIHLLRKWISGKECVGTKTLSGLASGHDDQGAGGHHNTDAGQQEWPSPPPGVAITIVTKVRHDRWSRLLPLIVTSKFRENLGRQREMSTSQPQVL